MWTSFKYNCMFVWLSPNSWSLSSRLCETLHEHLLQVRFRCNVLGQCTRWLSVISRRRIDGDQWRRRVRLHRRSCWWHRMVDGLVQISLFPGSEELKMAFLCWKWPLPVEHGLYTSPLPPPPLQSYFILRMVNGLIEKRLQISQGMFKVSYMVLSGTCPGQGNSNPRWIS